MFLGLGALFPMFVSFSSRSIASHSCESCYPTHHFETMRKESDTYSNGKRVLRHADTRVSMPTDSPRGHRVRVSVSFVQARHWTGTDFIIRPVAICSLCYLHWGGHGQDLADWSHLGVGRISIE